LDRISFFHNIAIENGKIISSEFRGGAGIGYYEITGYAVGLSAAHLKTELEQVSPPGEHNFGLYRSALQSTSPVEEFMHLYHILLMLFPPDERQADVDAFIVHEEPGVQQTQHPVKGPGFMETVYSRLRNELAHKRAGVNLDNEGRDGPTFGWIDCTYEARNRVAQLEPPPSADIFYLDRSPCLAMI
jgi:hypothetical protein